MSLRQYKTMATMLLPIRIREANEAKHHVFSKICVEGGYAWLRTQVDHMGILTNKDVLKRVELELDICPVLEMGKGE